jgi:hypothetical protein
LAKGEKASIQRAGNPKGTKPKNILDKEDNGREEV